MPTFEDVGKAIDREVEKIHRFLESEVKPATQQQLISALRAASKRLGELAEKLEESGRAPAAKD